MSSFYAFLWRDKVSGRGLKWSSFFILSAVLIASGFFVFSPVLADHTTTVTVEPLYVQGNHTDTYTFRVTNGGPDAIYKIVITADSDFTINGDPTCPSGWLASHTASTAECLTDGNPSNPDLLTTGSKTVSFSATSPYLTNDAIRTWTVNTNDNAWDGYNNIEAQTLVDVTLPVTTIVGDAPVGWQVEKPVSISLTCDDAGGSGCENIYYSTNGSDPTNVYSGPISISAEGETTIKYLSKDNAGNQESVNEVNIQIDTIAPETSDNADDDWHNFDVTATLTATDATPGSGVANIYYTTDGNEPTESDLYDSSFTLSIEGKHQLMYFSVDAAGNQEAVVSGSEVKIDKQIPITEIDITPADPNGDDVWYVTKPSIALSCTDQVDLSGCEAIYYSWDDDNYNTYTDTEPIEMLEGENIFYYYSTDFAGNSSITENVAFSVDTVLPAVNAGADEITNAEFTQDTTASDMGSLITTYAWSKESGPAESIITFGTAGAKDTIISADIDGIYIIRLTVTDNAGNSAFDEMQLTWDTVAPDVNITFPLVGDNVKGDAVIAFTNNEPTTSLCSIKQVDWVSCSSGVTQLSNLTGFAGLSEGSFTLYLKDTDVAGNEGTDSEAGIVKDTTAPEIDIFTAPEADVVYKVGQGGAPLVFTASDANSISCSYSINSGSPVSVDCSKGIAFSGTIPDNELSDGREEIVLSHRLTHYQELFH